MLCSPVDDSPLQILVLMSALGLARGQGSADQFTSFAVGKWWMTAPRTVFALVLGGIFIWIMNFKKVEPNKNDAATQAGEGDGDDDDSIPEESEEERNWRYLNAEMIEVSDPSILCVTDNFLFASACVIFLLGKFLGKPNNFSNQPVCRMSVKCCDGNSLRGSSDKIGTILC